jgi:toxin ParE1/3/4
MKRRLEVTPQARRDLAAILDWYRTELGAAAALKVAATIRKRLQALQAGKLKGASLSPQAPGYSRVVAKRHNIVFRIVGGVLYIVRIVHGAQDMEAVARNLDDPED